MPDYQSRVVRFSVFEVALRACELRRNGIKIKLQNQPVQILAMLPERPGETITRDEMRARLWSVETFVDFDHGLNSAIRRLRDALGDTAENPTFVETLGEPRLPVYFSCRSVHRRQWQGTERTEVGGCYSVFSVFRSREELLLENLALRQQLLALHAKRPRPRLIPSAGCSGSFCDKLAQAGRNR